MNLEQMNAFLAAAGLQTMTQEQYEAAQQAQQAAQQNGQTQNQEQQQDGQKGSQTGSQSDLERMIQRAVDRATNKLGNENKMLREQLEAAKKEKMTDDERRAYEMDEREKYITSKEKELQAQTNRLYAMRKLREAGLDNGTQDIMSLVDIVMGDDEAAIDGRIKTYKTMFDSAVEGRVKSVFKEHGREPKGSGGSEGGKGSEESIAVEIGKRTAEANKAAQATINQYMGG